MKPEILVTRQLFPEVLAHLGEHCTIDYHDQDLDLPRATLLSRLAGKRGLVSMLTDRIDGEVLAAAPDLRVVSNVAVGFNNIDVEACTRAGVIVTNTPGVLNETTADLVWALMMSSARRVVAADSWIRQGKWQGWKFHDSWFGQDIHGATLGILGLGRIGEAVARRAAGFDMTVIYHNPRPRSGSAGARWVEFDTLLREADFLVLMVPYSPTTHHVIGEAALAKMKPTAHLINVARGGVVDDAALIAALRSGKIAGAALDVFENEPTLNPGFFACDNVTLTPHIGSSTRATRLAMARCAADNMIAGLAGRPPENAVNTPLFLGRQA